MQAVAFPQQASLASKRSTAAQQLGQNQRRLVPDNIIASPVNIGRGINGRFPVLEADTPTKAYRSNPQQSNSDTAAIISLGGSNKKGTFLNSSSPKSLQQQNMYVGQISTNGKQTPGTSSTAQSARQNKIMKLNAFFQNVTNVNSKSKSEIEQQSNPKKVQTQDEEELLLRQNRVPSNNTTDIPSTANLTANQSYSDDKDKRRDALEQPAQQQDSKNYRKQYKYSLNNNPLPLQNSLNQQQQPYQISNYYQQQLITSQKQSNEQQIQAYYQNNQPNSVPQQQQQQQQQYFQTKIDTNGNSNSTSQSNGLSSLVTRVNRGDMLLGIPKTTTSTTVSQQSVSPQNQQQFTRNTPTTPGTQQSANLNRILALKEAKKQQTNGTTTATAASSPSLEFMPLGKLKKIDGSKTTKNQPIANELTANSSPGKDPLFQSSSTTLSKPPSNKAARSATTSLKPTLNPKNASSSLKEASTTKIKDTTITTANNPNLNAIDKENDERYVKLAKNTGTNAAAAIAQAGNNANQVNENVFSAGSPKNPIKLKKSNVEYYNSSMVSALKDKHFHVPAGQYFEGLFKEHFIQSFHSLQFCKTLKPIPFYVLQQKRISLQMHPQNQGKKTIVFDLDETLIHCNESTDIPADVIVPIKFPNNETVDAGINVRPYAKECLKELSQHFEIIVFTASHECYARKVIEQLDPDDKYISHKLFRDSCVQTPEGVHIKDMRIFANRNIKEIVLVDNAAYSFGLQIENGIPIIPFYEKKADLELKHLSDYLMQNILESNDVRETNKSYFKMHLHQACSRLEQVAKKMYNI